MNIFIGLLLLLASNIGAYSQYSSAIKFDRDVVLSRINYYRTLHNASYLPNSDSLNEFAQSYTRYLAEHNLFNDYNALNYGESKYKTNGLVEGTSTFLQAIDNWYLAKDMFDITQPVYTIQTRDFVNIVWKNTYDIGFGMTYSITSKSSILYVLYAHHDDYYTDFNKNIQSKLTTVYICDSGSICKISA